MNHDHAALQELEELLKRSKGMVISYSGGLDSSFLACVAHEVTGGREHCVILDSPLVPRRTIKEAKDRADSFGIPCEVVPLPIIEDEEFLKNPASRCYLCKKRGARILRKKAGEYGLGEVIDGVNYSDYQEFRPGIRAADEEGITHPLARCRLTKPMIRTLAKERGYPFWNLASSPCLATRIPYGDEISIPDLKRIEEAEEFLIHVGFPSVRVRVHRTLARIEVPGDDIARLFENRDSITKKMRELGFFYCTVDLEGFRSGSMDRDIPTGERGSR